MGKIFVALKTEHSDKGDRSNPNVAEVPDFFFFVVLMWIELAAFFLK